jgi:hypothetical protein
VLVDFIYEKDLFLKEKKVCLIEKTDSHVGDDIRLKKNN